jgi:enoyl-CoA hydratase/carnithine racemase
VIQAFQTVEVELDQGVLHVRFNRTDQLNALDDKMADELAVVFGKVVSSSSAKAVVISGNGGNFMAGADLRRLEAWAKMPAESVIDSLAVGFSAAMVEEVPVPVIAAVDGAAFGIGFDISMAADIVIATDRAVFALPEVDVGVVPLGGSSRILVQRLGLGRATQIVMLGERIKADRALEWGLATAVVAQADLDAAVAAQAKKLVRRSAVAMGAAKRLLRSTPAMSADAAAAAERQLFASCVASPDVVEGIAAVRERRRPQFGGAAE